MKKSKSILFLLACVTMALTSCLKDDFVNPRASFELYEATLDKDGFVESKTPVSVPAPDAESDTIVVPANQALLFVNTGDGTHFSIWTGDANHNYYSDGVSETGYDFPIGDGIIHTYTKTGVYDLIMFATSLNEDASEWPRTSISYVVKVVTPEP